MNRLPQSDSALTEPPVGHDDFPGAENRRLAVVDPHIARRPSPDVIVEVEAPPNKHTRRRLLRSASFPSSLHKSASSASTLFLSASSRSATSVSSPLILRLRQAPPPPPPTRGVKADMFLIWREVINSDHFIQMLVEFGYNWLQANTLHSYSIAYDVVLGIYTAIVVACWCFRWTRFLTRLLARFSSHSHIYCGSCRSVCHDN